MFLEETTLPLELTYVKFVKLNASRYWFHHMFVIFFLQSSWYFSRMFRSCPYCLTMTSNIKTFPNKIKLESSFLPNCTLFCFLLFAHQMQLRKVWTLF